MTAENLLRNDVREKINVDDGRIMASRQEKIMPVLEREKKRNFTAEVNTRKKN